MKKLMFVAVAAAAMAAVAETGVWTQQETPDSYAAYATASNWKNGYVPNQPNDSVDLSAFAKSTNDRAWWYGSTKAIFQNIKLPQATTELVLDDVFGGRQNRLRGDAAAVKNLYSFLNMSRYLGSIQLFQSSELRMRVAANETQELHKLVVSGEPVLKVEDGVVELGNLCGVGTLVKAGAGELKLSGVTSANGVRLKVSEGQLTLKGVPANPTPTAGAAAHFDVSDSRTLTCDAGGLVYSIADTRGTTEVGYRKLTPLYHYAPLVKYGDLQLLNLGAAAEDAEAHPDRKARWGDNNAFICDATISDVKTMFVVYRYNAADDFNGAKAFPVNSQSGNDMRRAYLLDYDYDHAKSQNAAQLCDWTAWNLFSYQQYQEAYQCYASQFIVTGDIRRNGEPVVYNETPRGFRDELEVMSFNFNTNHLDMGARSLNEWNFRYVARAQDAGLTGGCQIGEILVYTNALTDAEQKQTLDYLMAKWGRAEGKRPWLAASVGSLRGGEVYVPAGETAYVKSLDTCNSVLVKTGEGTLAARQIEGSGVICVKGGSVALLGGSAPTETGAGDVLPAPGMNAHFDASATDGMVFDADGKGIVRWNSSVTNNRTADHNDYLIVSNATKAALTGKIPFLTTDAANRQWVDFGELSVTSAKTLDTPNSGWFRVTRPSTGKDNGVDHVREIFWVWKTRPAADGQNPVLCGAGESDWWRYVRPGKGVMINPVSAYSDANHLSFLKYRNAQWAVNGKVVDPTAVNYPSDVHVVRVSLPDASYFGGVGNDDHYVKGGFQLGELITYTRELTDRERVDTEIYLLRKWTDKDHCEYVGAAPTAAQVVYDEAPTALAATEGVTVQMTGVKSEHEVPAALTSTAVVYHFDASDLSQMEYQTEGDGTLSLLKLYDPRANGKYATPFFSHKPRIRLGYQNGLSVIDLGQKGNANAADSDASELRFSNGDGTWGNGAIMGAIIVYANQPESDQYANVFGTYQGWGKNWDTGGATSFFDPNTSLDPQATEAPIYIDGTSKGQGKAEGTQVPSGFHVVAMNTGRGWGNRIDGVANLKSTADNCGGMLLCEVYVFSSSQSAANISAATEYLMKKWGIGGKKFDAVTPELSSISAAKGGTVKLAMAVNAATLAGPGTIDAPAVGGVSAIEATLFADRVEGPEMTGEVTLANAGTVTVGLADGVDKVQPGLYPILKAGAYADGTSLANWTLSAPTIRSRTFDLKLIGNTLYLDVRATGMVILVQ